MRTSYAKPRGFHRRCWHALFVGAAVLFCSCQAVPPHGQLASENQRAISAGSPVLTTTAHSAPREDSPSQLIAESKPAVRMVSHDEPAAACPPVASDLAVHGPPSLPPQAWTGAPAAVSGACPPCVMVADPGCGNGAWAPPGLACPWPPDEYICDGGDGLGQAWIARDWTPYGVEQEDTVAHYDTLDGKTRVQPSNRVCIYAPRFAAVRKVSGVVLQEQHDRVAGVELPTGPALSGSPRIATTVLQPLPPLGQRSSRSLQSVRERTRTVGTENAQAPAGAEGDLLPYQDFLAIRRGGFENSEKARLAMRLEAAVVWTHDKAVQVVIDNLPAVEASGDVGLQSVYTYEMPPGKPRLCIVKCASKADARPGELIDFTIRFENVGDQVIGNVTVIDNLSTRLEYVADSQSCSRKADFVTQENAGDSLVLRWEITDPVEVGAGGVIRFQCRVR